MKYLNPDCDRELYAFLFSVLKKHNCFTYRINGMADHIHLLFDLNSTMSISEIVKHLEMLPKKPLCPCFILNTSNQVR